MFLPGIIPPEALPLTVNDPFPVGKLPPQRLAQILSRLPADDPRLIVRPGIGIDCAVIDLGERCLVLKTDPITFASEEIGWFLVQVNANDIATAGATPRWLLLTMLLPEGKTRVDDVERIADQVGQACLELGISVIGGHTEITHGLERPILVGAMIGETTLDRLVTPVNARPGDRLLLTKSIPIEATAILAREFSGRLDGTLTSDELNAAKGYLRDPGISVVGDARIAMDAGSVHAMHDPTEGGLAAALWELAIASQVSLVVEPQQVPVSSLSLKICSCLGINPLAAIASGALLIAAQSEDTRKITLALSDAGIDCVEIGWIEAGEPGVWLTALPGEGRRQHLPFPERDDIARLFQVQ